MMADIRQGEGRFGANLTPRERFNRTMHYQHVDYVSHLEFGYWDELKEDWMRQGHLPACFRQADGTIPDRMVEEYFGVEQFESFGPRSAPIPCARCRSSSAPRTASPIRDGLGVLRTEQTDRHAHHPALYRVPHPRPEHLGRLPRRVPGCRPPRAGALGGGVARGGADVSHRDQPGGDRVRLVHRLGARLDRLREPGADVHGRPRPGGGDGGAPGADVPGAPAAGAGARPVRRRRRLGGYLLQQRARSSTRASSPSGSCRTWSR